MKIRCVCGGLIVDQSDFQRGKAYLVADQDWFDVLDDVAGSGPDSRLAQGLSRAMWQCGECGRLYLNDLTGTLHRFEPAESAAPRDLLASARGARWQGNLRGHWRAHVTDGPSGELWWQCGDDDSGQEQCASREELERRYHEQFRRLRGLDTLRSSFLRVGGVVVHQWPPGAEPRP